MSGEAPPVRSPSASTAGAVDPEGRLAQLRERRDRYPPGRYPVQHATAQFHLGAALTNAGRLEEARAALDVAVELFDRMEMGEEHGKALNALGAVLRMAGRLPEASAAFARARPPSSDPASRRSRVLRS